jgi:DNA repair exonuclease SbcCD nuclease subunit
MTKIAIIGDLHIGARDASKIHHAYMQSVLDEFFDYLKDNDIKYVIQLGDLFDSRKVLHLWAWDFFDKVIQPRLDSLGIHFFILVGNHDSHYRDTLAINTPELMLSNHKNVSVISEPVDVVIGDQSFLLIPWINKTNHDTIMKMVSDSESKYCCGHFEFDGFDLYKGNPAKGHFKHTEFKKFERVYSGHYHTSSHKDNVVYSGTPYELTWQDCDDAKSFIIHNESSYDVIRTNKTLYNKIRYSEDTNIDESEVRNKIIRVVVDKRPDKILFNKFIQQIESFSPHEVKIQEIFSDTLSEDVVSVDITKTRDVIIEYLDGSKIDLDKDKILSIFDELYNAAINEVE